MGADTIIQIAIVLGTILFSMTLHEAMHAFVGYWLGDDTAKREGRLTLNPIKHIDPDQVRGGDWGAALVALGGPLTNLVIAFIFFGVWALVGAPTTGIGSAILGTMISVHLGFFIFNMIPIPPLDGSRVLYAVAPEFVRSGMRFIEQYGIILVFILVLVAGRFLSVYMGEAIEFFLWLFSQVFRVV